MRKGIIALIVAFGLVGCQSSQDAKTKEITDGTNTVENDLNFQIVKSEVTDEIAPTNKNKTYKYVKAEEGHIFIEVILKTENLTDKEIKLDDLYSGKIRVDKQTYQLKVAVESASYNQLSTTDTLKGKETRYVHVYCDLPKDQLKQEATLQLNVNHKENYTYTFSTEKVVVNNDVKSTGDTLSLNQSDIVLKDIIETKKLEPSVKGFFYSFIPTDNDDETFVALQIELKNNTESALHPSEYMYCEYQVNNETIQSQIMIESENHKSISKTSDIPATSTRTVYLAMNVKDSLLNQEAKIQLYVEGHTFMIEK